MYGPVLGPAITAGSVVALPDTGGNSLALFLTLTCLTIGATITIVSVARIIAARIFNS